MTKISAEAGFQWLHDNPLSVNKYKGDTGMKPTQGLYCGLPQDHELFSCDFTILNKDGDFIGWCDSSGESYEDILNIISTKFVEAKVSQMLTHRDTIWFVDGDGVLDEIRIIAIFRDSPLTNYNIKDQQSAYNAYLDSVYALLDDASKKLGWRVAAIFSDED